MMRRDVGMRDQHRQEGHCMRHLSNEGGFTFVELLAVVLLLGILVLVALPNYFGAENDARREVDRANVRSVNAALALYRFRNNGTCPAAGGVAGFLADTPYFPDRAPTAPWTTPAASQPDVNTYNAALCRVQMSVAGPPAIDHTTGIGH